MLAMVAAQLRWKFEIGPGGGQDGRTAGKKPIWVDVGIFTIIVGDILITEWLT